MSDMPIERAAAALGYDNADMLYKMEKGARPVPYEVLIKMAAMYKVSTDFLLGLTPVAVAPERLWRAEYDTEAVLAALRGGLISCHENAAFCPEPEAPAGEPPDTTLALDLAKFRSVYPLGAITVETDGGTVTAKAFTTTRLTRRGRPQKPAAVETAAAGEGGGAEALTRAVRGCVKKMLEKE